MSGKNLVLGLNAKILLANQISGFLNFNISCAKQVHAVTYLLKLQNDDVILHELGHAWPGIPKEAIKTFKVAKTKAGIKLILCMQLHIY